MKNLLMTILLSVGLTIPAMSFQTPVRFSESQKEHLIFACDYAKRTDLYDKHDDICYIFSALIWQESGAGLKTSGGNGHIAYGVFQNYLPTVRSRFKQKGINISDKEIVQLLNDRNYSAIFAETEIKDWLKYRKGNMYKALASYFGGWKWERAKWYADAVLKKADYLKNHTTFLEPRWNKRLRQDNNHIVENIAKLKLIQNLKTANIIEVN